MVAGPKNNTKNYWSIANQMRSFIYRVQSLNISFKWVQKQVNVVILRSQKDCSSHLLVTNLSSFLQADNLVTNLLVRAALWL